MTALNSRAPFTEQDRLRDLIDQNSSLLMAISRFGISLGFGNDTVKEVCRQRGIDISTFLTVVNFLSNRRYDASGVSPGALMLYLRRAHDYFLGFQLPAIRRKLIEAITCGNGNTEISVLLLKFFDEYVEEIRGHMEYENDRVFSYIAALLEEENKEIALPKGLFSDRHEDVARKLRQLKDIIVSYYPQKNSDLMNSTLFDIISCEKDILSHCAIEDHLFEPAVRELEISRGRKVGEVVRDDSDAHGNQITQLSDREREIIKLVACGMSNKEIADLLCISVNTVTTHRRNLSAKLDIHSPSALTIFAIINGLVEIEEIKSQSGLKF